MQQFILLNQSDIDISEFKHECFTTSDGKVFVPKSTYRAYEYNKTKRTLKDMNVYPVGTSVFVLHAGKIHKAKVEKAVIEAGNKVSVTYHLYSERPSLKSLDNYFWEENEVFETIDDLIESLQEKIVC